MFSSMLMKFDPFCKLEMPFENHSFGRMELDVRDNEIIAKIPVPGCSRDSINIKLENDILSVCAQKKYCCEHNENKKDKIIRHERLADFFEESVKLPVSVDPKKSEAHYEHGILTIKMARHESEKDQVHTIKVN